MCIRSSIRSFCVRTALCLLALLTAGSSLLAQQPGPPAPAPLFPGLPQPPLTLPGLPAQPLIQPPVNLPRLRTPSGEPLPLPNWGPRRAAQPPQSQNAPANAALPENGSKPVDGTNLVDGTNPTKEAVPADSTNLTDGTNPVDGTVTANAAPSVNETTPTNEAASVDEAAPTNEAAPTDGTSSVLTAGTESPSETAPNSVNVQEQESSILQNSETTESHGETASETDALPAAQPQPETAGEIALEPASVPSAKPESAHDAAPESVPEHAFPLSLPPLQLPLLPDGQPLLEGLRIQPLNVLPLPTLQNCRKAGVPIPDEAPLQRLSRTLGLFPETTVDASKVQEDIQPTDTKPLRDMDEEEISKLFDEQDPEKPEGN